MCVVGGGAERDRGTGRENNIVLKAITLNSPQFRHESEPLSLTRGKENERKEGAKNSEGEKRKTDTLRSIPMSDRRLISAPGRDFYRHDSHLGADECACAHTHARMHARGLSVMCKQPGTTLPLARL